MKIAPPPALKPLDLSRTPHGSPRPLAARDLSPEARLTKAAPTQHDRVQKQTEKWVAQTFFGTLLKQMDDSPFKSELFSGGRGGQAFSSLYHQQLADRIARGAGHKLVKSIVRSIEAKQNKSSASGVQGSAKSEDRHSDATRAYRAPARQTSRSTLDLRS